MKRKSIVFLTALALTAGSGIAAAAVITPGIAGPGLAAVGPVSAADGFPVWYKDKNGLRLEPCGISSPDPMCPAVGAVPDPSAPVSFPNNYPDEGFYSSTAAKLDTAAGKALGEIDLEQAFRNGPVAPGDQVTFARVRLKLLNATPNVDYTFTSPAGVKTLQASDPKKPGLIFDTEDIGVGGVGDFTGALGGRVGPFLTWDTYPADAALKPNAAGADTYVGDGATLHAIKGSPYGSNIFRIQGPGINPTPLSDLCPTVSGPFADCMETNLFTVQGKLATTSGVTAEQATYSRSSAGAGTLDVFASSQSGPQAIQVSDASRVAYTGAQPPSKVQVSNTGDVPVSNKTINVVDQISGKASYDTGTQQLSVNAVSSDTAVPRTLAVSGYGALAAGTFVSPPLVAPPVSVTVTSDAGGSAVLPVQITGSARAPIPVVAQAGPDQSVSTGQLVTLDGSASVGAATFAWTSPAGIVLANPTSANPTFTAPAPGSYTFTLTVTGPGGPSTATVTITVTAAVNAVANAGPDQSGVQRGTKVTLDGTKSVGAATYAWTQVRAAGDPVVTLAGAGTAQPTFTFPFYAFPANAGPLTFNLHVTSPNGTASNDSISVTPSADTVVIAKANYTTSNKSWRVDGTSSIIGAGQIVTAHLGPLSGPVIGTSIVDVTGAFSVRTTPALVGTAGQSVSVESQLGGTSQGFVIRVQ
jgi:PKD repeat protein